MAKKKTPDKKTPTKKTGVPFSIYINGNLKIEAPTDSVAGGLFKRYSKQHSDKTVELRKGDKVLKTSKPKTAKERNSEDED